MKNKIIERIKDLINKANIKEENDTISRVAKNYELIGLYKALNAVYDVLNEEINKNEN